MAYAALKGRSSTVSRICRVFQQNCKAWMMPAFSAGLKGLLHPVVHNPGNGLLFHGGACFFHSFRSLLQSMIGVIHELGR
jgi:hypothetical protein